MSGNGNGAGNAAAVRESQIQKLMDEYCSNIDVDKYAEYFVGDKNKFLSSLRKFVEELVDDGVRTVDERYKLRMPWNDEIVSLQKYLAVKYTDKNTYNIFDEREDWHNLTIGQQKTALLRAELNREQKEAAGKYKSQSPLGNPGPQIYSLGIPSSDSPYRGGKANRSNTRGRKSRNGKGRKGKGRNGSRKNRVKKSKSRKTQRK